MQVEQIEIYIEYINIGVVNISILNKMQVLIASIPVHSVNNGGQDSVSDF